MSENLISKDIGAPENVYVPVYVDTSGVYRRTPRTGLLDIAGIYGSNFTIGGKAVMLADGSSSDGSGAIDLQTVYFHSQAVNGAAKINLSAGKDFAICDSLGNSYITVDAETGKVTISGEMSVISSIVKFTGAYQEFNHLNILSSDGGRTALLVEPLNGVNFTTDAVRIRTSASGPVDFSINAQGQTYIRDLIVDSIDANLIDGVDFAAISSHLSPTASPFKHFASEIRYVPSQQAVQVLNLNGGLSVNSALDQIIDTFSGRLDTLSAAIDLILADEQSETSFFQRIVNLEGNVFNINQTLSTQSQRIGAVETDVAQIKTRLTEIATTNLTGINFEQISPSTVWSIYHNTGSPYIQYSVYDSSNRAIWPDDAFALDDNTFVIVFSNEQVGRAILTCLAPPLTTITGGEMPPVAPA